MTPNKHSRVARVSLATPRWRGWRRPACSIDAKVAWMAARCHPCGVDPAETEAAETLGRHEVLRQWWTGSCPGGGGWDPEVLREAARGGRRLRMAFWRRRVAPRLCVVWREEVRVGYDAWWHSRAAGPEGLLALPGCGRADRMGFSGRKPRRLPAGNDDNGV